MIHSRKLPRTEGVKYLTKESDSDAAEPITAASINSCSTTRSIRTGERRPKRQARSTISTHQITIRSGSGQWANSITAG